jgi:hypothetical protein
MLLFIKKKKNVMDNLGRIKEKRKVEENFYFSVGNIFMGKTFPVTSL